MISVRKKVGFSSRKTITTLKGESKDSMENMDIEMLSLLKARNIRNQEYYYKYVFQYLILAGKQATSFEVELQLQCAQESVHVFALEPRHTWDSEQTTDDSGQGSRPVVHCL